MANITSTRLFTPLLDPRKLDQKIIRNWNIIQEESLSKTVRLIENNSNYIYLFNPIQNTSEKDISDSLDEETIKYISVTDKVNVGIRNQLKKYTDHLGLLIPVLDISNIHPKDLPHTMNILSHFTADLKYVEFLDFLKEENKLDQAKDNTEIRLARPIAGVLYVIEKYINQVLYSDSLMGSITHLDGWLSLYSPEDKNQLSTQQFLSWIYRTIDNVICNENPSRLEEFADYHTSVGLLIKKYRREFIDELKEIKDSNSKNFYFSSFPEFGDDLRQLLEEDYDLLMVSVLFKNWDKLGIFDKGSYNHIYMKAVDQESIVKIIGKAFNKSRMAKAVKSILSGENFSGKLSLFKNGDLVFDDLIIYKSRLASYDITNLKELGKSLEQSTKYSRDINKSKEDYICGLGNSISAPFFYWKVFEGKFLLSLNIADKEGTQRSLGYIDRKKAHERAEADLIKRHVESLKGLQTRTAIDNFINTVPRFFYHSNQKRWGIAIRNAEEGLKMRMAFRQQKMKELGIDLNENFTNAQKEVFLSEMLAIEYEIRSFVPYVTAAFQSALPSKRTTEFDPYRHQSDGIEFDPETVYDPEKWMRGNVMKTLKTKVKKGEVTQVNCFCLDLSGSMHHDRMRNLYKILYLLVTGLQSRKSFDAFHFFSNNFISGVDFNYEYTRKNLLFQILTIVSKVVGPRIEYSGLQGTNISDGIIGCEESMVEFIKKLKAKQPKINLTCSMFVITDGEPSLGVRNPNELNKFIEKRRKETNFAIKGIYIKSQNDLNQFISTIFGEDNAAETSSFEEAVDKLTAMMSKTYKEQRVNHKWEIKRAQLAGK